MPSCVIVSPGLMTAFCMAVVLTGLSDRALSNPLLDKDGLLPSGRNPASVPAADGRGTTTAVAMRDDTRDAILLFDATDQSKRHYDFISCLDGLTVGLGNWPQARFGGLMAAIGSNGEAQAALIKRSSSYFRTHESAWRAFVADTGTNTGTVSDEAVAEGYKALFPVGGRKNRKIGITGAYACRPVPGKGVSYYQDYKDWLVPIVRTAFRDPSIVSVQVRKWEDDVLEPAIDVSRAMGITGPGIYLIAFVKSNGGQSPGLKAAIDRRTAPASLAAGGVPWSWDKPPKNLSGASRHYWQMLLMWQSMCPRTKHGFRIRNRNRLFFKQYLSHRFRLPAMRAGGLPDGGSTANCNPARASLVTVD